MKNPTVSVIIPVYNEENYIEECLFSLLAQTLRPLEIIVVDDGSTDRTPKILSNLQIDKLQNCQLKILKQNHQGPAKARNFGVKVTTGKILVFLDSDMRFEKKYLEKIVKPIIGERALATFTKEEYVANPDNIWSQCWSINSSIPFNLHIDPAMPDRADNFRAILKEVFLKTKGYKNVGYGEDVTVLSQLKGIKAVVALGAVCYHFNPSSLIEVFSSARWMGRGETLKRNLKTFFTFFFLNSLRRGIEGSISHKKPQYLVFKLVFDFGVFLGFLEKKFLRLHVK